MARTRVGGAGNAARCTSAVARGVSTEAALTACSRAIERDNLVRRDITAAYVNRGVLRLRRQEPEAALADFDAALARDPDLGEAHLNRGAALLMIAQPGPAVAALTLALSHGVSEPYKAYYNRGAAREALGDETGALEDYSTALDIHPNWGPAEVEIARFVRARHAHLAQLIGPAGSRGGLEQEQEAQE